MKSMGRETEFIREGYGTLRVCTDCSGNVWFSAADILTALGLSRSALRRVDREDRCPDLFAARRTKAAGGNRRSCGIRERGVFLLILACRKPKAEGFRRWFTREVLPSIRKGEARPAQEEMLTKQERKDMEDQIRQLSEQISRAEKAKRKLSSYLSAEEDRVFGLQEDLRYAEREIFRLRERLDDPETLKTLLAGLIEKRERERPGAGTAKEKRPAPVIPEEPLDPFVFDRGGNLMRRNEFISLDRK